MFVLKFAEKNKEVQEVEDTLKQMSLAYSIEENEDLKEVILMEDETRFSGLEAINNHLDKLSGELNSWYYCNC